MPNNYIVILLANLIFEFVMSGSRAIYVGTDSGILFTSTSAINS